MANFLVLNGPNLNLLGKREPSKYGYQTLANIESELREQAEHSGHQILFFQSNAEYELINRIHDASNEGINFIIINPAAFTHTSIAMRDALLGVNIPFIEVHISNVHARESFRQHSYFSDIAQGTIVGLGTKGYRLALLAAIETIEPPKEAP